VRRTRSRRFAWFSATALTLSTALAGALTMHAAGRTVWDGVYTAAQAERGTVLYAEQCSRCHGDFLDGAGAGERVVALTGVTFEENWESASLSDLFDTIARTMPRGAPGTMTGRQVLDVMAFLLQSNGYPGGATELTETAELASIDIVGRDGPRPLRAGAGVRSVGCLAKEAGDLWTLVQASEPVRTRNPMASSERDLARARAIPLGSRTITLAGSAPGRESGLGMKVEVKGVLSAADSPHYRITVMSLQAIAPACS
jgi:S-disulfanyl-L-cysteine oxidoreductase SoxD